MPWLLCGCSDGNSATLSSPSTEENDASKTQRIKDRGYLPNSVELSSVGIKTAEQNSALHQQLSAVDNSQPPASSSKVATKTGNTNDQASTSPHINISLSNPSAGPSSSSKTDPLTQSPRDDPSDPVDLRVIPDPPIPPPSPSTDDEQDPNLIHWADTRLPKIGLPALLKNVGIHTIDQLLAADQATLESIQLKPLPKKKFFPSLDDLKAVQANGGDVVDFIRNGEIRQLHKQARITSPTIIPLFPSSAPSRKQQPKPELDEEEMSILQEAIGNVALYEAEKQYTHAELVQEVDRETVYVSHLNNLYCDADELKITEDAMKALLKSKEEHQSRANRLLSLIVALSSPEPIHFTMHPNHASSSVSTISASASSTTNPCATNERVKFDTSIKRVFIDFNPQVSAGDLGSSVYVVRDEPTSARCMSPTKDMSMSAEEAKTRGACKFYNSFEWFCFHICLFLVLEKTRTTVKKRKHQDRESFQTEQAQDTATPSTSVASVNNNGHFDYIEGQRNSDGFLFMKDVEMDELLCQLEE
ncbi:hypothetical protein EON65_28660 [archaeon]|nr:MAG: hypothetical protein EON65_28660 [archaeon]